MSLIHMDGFAAYEDGDDAANVYVPIGISALVINTTIGRTSPHALQTSINNHALFAHSSFNNGKVFVGVAFRFTGLPGANDVILSFRASSLDQAYLRLNSSGNLEIVRAPSTVLDTGTKVLAINTWYYIEIKMTLSNSTNTNDVIVNVDGIEDINLTSGSDTSFTSLALDAVGFEFGMVGQTGYYDDLYILDDLSNPNSFLGVCIIEEIKPNGNGNSSDWDGSDADQVDNYLHVDEDVRDDDTSYIEAQVANDLDLFTYENLSLNPLSIYGIMTTTWGKTIVGTHRSVKNTTRSGGTNYFNSEQIFAQDKYTSVRDIEVNDPDTSLSWTKSGINNAEFGLRVEA